MGDFWFLEGPDALHMYYLMKGSPSPQGFRDVGIGHATSADGIRWAEHEPIMLRGAPGAFDDAAIYTGSGITIEGRHYILYTGIHSGDHTQRSGLLTSDDLHHWQRHEGNPVMEPDPRWYETEADYAGGKYISWRDPWLWHNPDDGFCYAFVTATARGDTPRHERGCIGLARSRDLRQWEILPPVSATGMFHDLEVPQVFELNGRWYLIHLMCMWRYSQRAFEARPPELWLDGTYYMVADHPLGPWHIPEHDVIAGCRGHAPLAARVQQVGGDLLLYAWGPRRRELSVPMKVAADPDGRLRACYWHGLDTCASGDLCPAPPQARAGVWQMGEAPSGRPQDWAAVAGYGVEGRDLMVTATASPTPGAAMGLGVSCGDRTLAGVLDGALGVARIVDLPARHVLGESPWCAAADGPVRLRLIADGEVVTLYANDEFAATAYIAERPPGEAQLVVERGSARFTDVEGCALDL